MKAVSLIFIPLIVLTVGMSLSYADYPAPPHLMKHYEYRPTRLEKFFDLNKDGILDLYEKNLITTQKFFGWPLANSKKMRKFDANRDRMLEPYEYDLYRHSKKSPSDEGPRIIPILQ